MEKIQLEEGLFASSVFVESTLTLYLLFVGPKLTERLWELTFPTSNEA